MDTLKYKNNHFFLELALILLVGEICIVISLTILLELSGPKEMFAAMLGFGAIFFKIC